MTLEIEMPTKHQYFRYPGQMNPQPVFLYLNTQNGGANLGGLGWRNRKRRVGGRA
jgi:hypothetical protein